jgi:hypothetical protein
MLMEPAYFSVYNLSKPSLFEDIFAMAYNLNSGLLYSSRAMRDKLPPLVIGK